MLLAAVIFGGWVFYRARQPANDDLSQEHPAAAEARDCLAKGEVALSENHPSEAEQYFRNALAQDPEQHQARANLVYLLTIECRTYEALAQRHELLRRDRCTIEDLLFMGKPEDVLQTPELDRFLQHHPDDPHLLLAKARIAKTVYRYAAANRWVEQALAAKPNSVESQAEQGLLLLELDPTEQALTRWQRGLAAGADEHPDVWLVRGTLAKMLHDPRGATRCFAEVLLRDPNHRPATHQLSLTLSALGEESLAAELSARVKVLDVLSKTIDDLYSFPDSRQSWLKAAGLLESLGRMREACAWYRTIDTREGGNLLAKAKAEELRTRLSPQTPVVVAEANPLLKLDIERFPLPSVEHIPLQTSPRDSGEEHQIRFSDVAQRTGLDFAIAGADASVHHSRAFYDLMGAGIAVIDFDLDGWPDLCYPRGTASDGHRVQSPHLGRLYRNTGDGRFVDVTRMAQVGENRFSQGAAVGDFNNDGFPDIFVANVGENRLYQNNGDGTFSDISGPAAIEGARWTTSCAIADLNGDGLPDIYEVNYLGGDRVSTMLCGGLAGSDCIPRHYPSESDRFFLNLGDGQFAERSEESGIVAADGKGLGVVVADFDGDGLPSVFVANDTTANHFYVNRAGRGAIPRFEERATLAGLAFDRNGLAQGCMGIAVDDFDADGELDLFITNFFDESNTLYSGGLGQYFEDATRPAGLYLPSLPMVGFGTQFLDADLDGDPDLVVANGHISDRGQDGAEFQMRPQCFENRKGRFAELFAPDAGAYFNRKLLGRSLAKIDFDRDGREDFVVTHLDAPVALLHNETPNAGHFLSIRLTGVRCDRDALGATVTVLTENGVRRVRQVTAGDGYMSSNQRQLVFGLGAESSAKQVVVRWPSGTSQEFGAVMADRELIIVEGGGAFLHVTK